MSNTNGISAISKTCMIKLFNGRLLNEIIVTAAKKVLEITIISIWASSGTSTHFEEKTVGSSSLKTREMSDFLIPIIHFQIASLYDEVFFKKGLL